MIYALEQLPPDVRRMVRSLLCGEEAVITENAEPIAHLSATGSPASPGTRRKFGFAGGLLIHMADDFNNPVDDFGDL
jgi:hypothetical protein